MYIYIDVYTHIFIYMYIYYLEREREQTTRPGKNTNGKSAKGQVLPMAQLNCQHRRIVRCQPSNLQAFVLQNPLLKCSIGGMWTSSNRSDHAALLVRSFHIISSTLIRSHSGTLAPKAENPPWCPGILVKPSSGQKSPEKQGDESLGKSILCLLHQPFFTRAFGFQGRGSQMSANLNP